MMLCTSAVMLPPCCVLKCLGFLFCLCKLLTKLKFLLLLSDSFSNIAYCRLEFYDANNNFGKTTTDEDEHPYSVDTPSPTDYKDVNSSTKVSLLNHMFFIITIPFLRIFLIYCFLVLNCCYCLVWFTLLNFFKMQTPI